MGSFPHALVENSGLIVKSCLNEPEYFWFMVIQILFLGGKEYLSA